MNARQWILLLTLASLWGGSFFFVEVLVKALPPLTIVLLRVGIAAAALHLYLLWRGEPLSWVHWRVYAVMGLLNNAIPFSLIVWGQGHISSSLASILNATTPLFTVLVANWLTSDEKFTPARLAGTGLGFAGVAVMLGGEDIGGSALGQLAVLGAALTYAFAVVFGRRFRRLGISALHSATGQLTGSTLLLLPVVMVVDSPWQGLSISTTQWGAMLALALLSTALAYRLFFSLLASAGATNVSLVTLLVPVSAIALGVLVLGESLSGREVIGVVILGLGLLVVDGRLWQRWRQSKTPHP